MANTTVYPFGTDGSLPSSVGIINDLVTGGVDKALSAQQGVVLNERITSVMNSGLGVIEVDEDGIFFVDELFRVGGKITSDGFVSVGSMLTFEYVND